MRRGAVVLVLAGACVGSGVPTYAQAAPQANARCIRAWNAPANRANQQLARALAGAHGSLTVGNSYSFTWGSGNGSHSTSARPVCVLVIVHRPGRGLAFSGRWHHGTLRYARLEGANGLLGPRNVRVTLAGTLRVLLPLHDPRGAP